MFDFKCFKMLTKTFNCSSLQIFGMYSTYNSINPDEMFDSVVEIDENRCNPSKDAESFNEVTLEMESYSESSTEYVVYEDHELTSTENESCAKNQRQTSINTEVEAKPFKETSDELGKPSCSSSKMNNNDKSQTRINKLSSFKSMFMDSLNDSNYQTQDLSRCMKYSNFSSNEWFIKSKRMYALVYKRIYHSKAKQLDVVKKFKIIHGLSNEIKAEIVVTELKKKSKTKTYVYYMQGLNYKLKGNYLRRAKFKTIPNFSSKLLKSSQLKNCLFELVGINEKIKSFKEFYSTSLNFLIRKGFRKIAIPHFNSKSSYKKATCDAIEATSKFIEKNPNALDEVTFYSPKRHIYSSFVEAYCKSYDSCRARMF